MDRYEVEVATADQLVGTETAGFVEVEAAKMGVLCTSGVR